MRVLAILLQAVQHLGDFQQGTLIVRCEGAKFLAGRVRTDARARIECRLLTNAGLVEERLRRLKEVLGDALVDILANFQPFD